MSNSNVLIIYTGGTFGMVPEDKEDSSSSLVAANLEDIERYVPSLLPNGYFANNGVNVAYKTIGQVVDSSDFNPENWKQIAGIIEKDYEVYDGFIVIQGTDTMAYTASALSFMLEGLDKPVILTGSQLPISDPRTDAVSNLTNAIFVAAYRSFNIQKVPEVLISFNDELLRGNRATKYSTNDLEGFESPNYRSLASLEDKIVVNLKYVKESKNADLQVLDGFDTNVIIVTLFPGFQPSYLKSLIKGNKIHGIIFRSFGAGNSSSSPEFLEMLENAKEQGILMLNTTQCYQGSVEHGKYKANHSLQVCGVINGRDLTLESSITKMMWCLGNYSKEKAKEMLAKPIRGEMSN